MTTGGCSIVKNAHLRIFELEASPVEGQSLQQKDKRRKRNSKNSKTNKKPLDVSLSYPKTAHA